MTQSKSPENKGEGKLPDILKKGLEEELTKNRKKCAEIMDQLAKLDNANMQDNELVWQNLLFFVNKQKRISEIVSGRDQALPLFTADGLAQLSKHLQDIKIFSQQRSPHITEDVYHKQVTGTLLATKTWVVDLFKIKPITENENFAGEVEAASTKFASEGNKIFGKKMVPPEVNQQWEIFCYAAKCVAVALVVTAACAAFSAIAVMGISAATKAAVAGIVNAMQQLVPYIATALGAANTLIGVELLMPSSNDDNDKAQQQAADYEAQRKNEAGQIFQKKPKL